jgi:hypothetical protein
MEIRKSMAIKIQRASRPPTKTKESTIGGFIFTDLALVDIDILLRPFGRVDILDILANAKPITHKMGNLKWKDLIFNKDFKHGKPCITSVGSMSIGVFGRDLANKCPICLGTGSIVVFNENKKRTIKCPNCQKMKLKSNYI